MENQPDNSGRNALRIAPGIPPHRENTNPLPMATNGHCSLDRPVVAENTTHMADDQKPDEQIDPVTRVAMMAQAGEVKKITSKMLEEALEYSRMKDKEREALERNDESAS